MKNVSNRKERERGGERERGSEEERRRERERGRERERERDRERDNVSKERVCIVEISKRSALEAALNMDRGL